VNAEKQVVVDVVGRDSFDATTPFCHRSALVRQRRTRIIDGDWQGVTTLEYLDQTGRAPQGATETDTYRADGTFQVTQTPSDGSPPGAWEGTYTEDSAGLFTATGTTSTGESRTTTFRLLEDTALVSPNRIWVRK
jgi:hypothetical protein